MALNIDYIKLLKNKYAACRMNEISYSKFINGLNLAGVTVNRKMLAELAIDSPEAFTSLVVIAKDALNGKKYEPKTVAASKSASVKEVSEDAAKTKKTAAKKTTTKKDTTKKDETKKTTTKKTTTAKNFFPKKFHSNIIISWYHNNGW